MEPARQLGLHRTRSSSDPSGELRRMHVNGWRRPVCAPLLRLLAGQTASHRAQIFEILPDRDLIWANVGQTNNVEERGSLKRRCHCADPVGN